MQLCTKNALKAEVCFGTIKEVFLNENSKKNMKPLKPVVIEGHRKRILLPFEPVSGSLYLFMTLIN